MRRQLVSDQIKAQIAGDAQINPFHGIVSSSMTFRGIQALCLAGIWAITDCVWTKRECPSERVGQADGKRLARFPQLDHTLSPLPTLRRVRPEKPLKCLRRNIKNHFLTEKWNPSPVINHQHMISACCCDLFKQG